MEVMARVMNGDEHAVEVPDGATYARLLDEIGENPEAAVVVVDGRPVPEDAKVDADEVEVMRTVSGGSSVRPEQRQSSSPCSS
jgi:sulfur carrier protein